MEPILIIAVLVFAVVVLGVMIFIAGIILYPKDNMTEEGKPAYPQGYGLCTGLVLGAGFGLVLGLLIDHLSLGIPIGGTTGVILGCLWERGNRIRPLTELERRRHIFLIAAGLVVLVSGAACFLLIG